MARETWYILEDGDVADPRDVVHDDDGILHHKDGRAVGYSEYGPRSSSVDPEEQAKKPKASGKSKDMKPEEAKSGYKTREAKGK